MDDGTSGVPKRMYQNAHCHTGSEVCFSTSRSHPQTRFLLLRGKSAKPQGLVPLRPKPLALTDKDNHGARHMSSIIRCRDCNPPVSIG